jgi:hypothetical protein
MKECLSKSLAGELRAASNESEHRFWEDYVYPKWEKIYFEMFPEEEGKKHDPDGPEAGKESLEYMSESFDPDGEKNNKALVAICAWLKRDGLSHSFEGVTFFVIAIPAPSGLWSRAIQTTVALRGIDGRCYSCRPQDLATVLEQVACENAKKAKWIERLTPCLVLLALFTVAGLVGMIKAMVRSW